MLALAGFCTPSVQFVDALLPLHSTPLHSTPVLTHTEHQALAGSYSGAGVPQLSQRRRLT